LEKGLNLLTAIVGLLEEKQWHLPNQEKLRRSYEVLESVHRKLERAHRRGITDLPETIYTRTRDLERMVNESRNRKWKGIDWMQEVGAGRNHVWVDRDSRTYPGMGSWVKFGNKVDEFFDACQWVEDRLMHENDFRN